MIYFVGHFNIEDLYYPEYTKLGTAGGACLYAAMGAYLWTERIAVISRIGDDYPAGYVRRLREMGVELHLRRMPGPTMASRTEYAPGSDRVFTMKNPPARLDELTPDLEDVQAAKIPRGACVHIGAMNLAKLERITDYLRREKDCFISVDTCDAFVREDWPRLLAAARKANLFLPSRAELYACPVRRGTIREQMLWLQEQLGRTGLIVKDGQDGSLLAEGGRITRIPVCRQARPVDMTGAGDSFCGGVLAGMALPRRDPIRACVMGTVSASYIIQQAGAFPESPVPGQDRDLRYTSVYKKLTQGG